MNLRLLQDKGGKKFGGKVELLIGMVLVVVLVTALAPTIFTNLGLLGEETPAWVASVLIVIVGAGLVLLVWKTFE